jgi:hypothetical protein
MDTASVKPAGPAAAAKHALVLRPPEGLQRARPQPSGRKSKAVLSHLVRGILDRLLLIGAVVAGGLVPGFISQYRQRLGGRLDQARLDLAPWQKLADQYQHGDLNALIGYHLKSQDPTFQAEGAVIQSLVHSVEALQAAVTALHTGLFQQVAYLATHGDPALARATWADWVPTFSLSGEGIAFALLFGLLVWLVFQGLWWLLARLAGSGARGRRYA